MAAIAIGLIEAFGLGKGSNIARGLFVVLVYQTTIFDKMLIAGASSITARGAIEKFGGVQVLWSQWFLAYVPCDIIVMLFAWWLALWLYPPEVDELPGTQRFLEQQLDAMGGWSSLETFRSAQMQNCAAAMVTKRSQPSAVLGRRSMIRSSRTPKQ